MDPFATSTCRLCRVAIAKIRFTDELRMIDVSCETCGHYRVELPSYETRLDELTGDQRLEIIGRIKTRRAAGDRPPVITSEELKTIVLGE